MSALYEIDSVSLDLAAPTAGLQRLLPGPAPRMTILSHLSLSVGQGEMLGLVGESGSGKSTLARAMMGLADITSGTLRFAGQPVKTRTDFIKVRQGTALMFQDAVASLSPRRKVAAQLVEPFQINGVPLPQGKKTATTMLERVGLSPALAQRYPHELSGGQARRVSVARALALNPKLVIADEPTAGLDVSVQAEILNLMSGLRRELGLSFLIITHNLAVVRHVTDRVAVLYLGRMAEWGPTREVFARPCHPYTRSLIAAEPQADPRKRRADLALKGEIPSVLARPPGCEFHTRCPLARPRCAAEEPQPRMITPDRMVRCHFAEELKQANEGGNHGTELEH